MLLAQGCKTETRQCGKDKHKMKKDPQKEYRLGTVSKKITGWFSTNLILNSDVDQDT